MATSNKVSKTVSRATEGLELISNGLLLLESVEPELSQMVGPKIVDISARLNASYLKAEKILNPLKDRLKVEAISSGLVDGEFPIPGETLEALVSKYSKTVLDGDKIKLFFGRTIGKYLKKTSITSVSFRARG